jgi:hypothetical protein
MPASSLCATRPLHRWTPRGVYLNPRNADRHHNHVWRAGQRYEVLQTISARLCEPSGLSSVLPIGAIVVYLACRNICDHGRWHVCRYFAFESDTYVCREPGLIDCLDYVANR